MKPHPFHLQPKGQSRFFLDKFAVVTTQMAHKVYDANSCIMTDFFRMAGGKWKSVILYLLRKDINRFSLLLERMPTISKKVLTQQLRELEADGLISRNVLVAKAPMVVVYELSDKGRSLRQLIDGIIDWNISQSENNVIKIPASG